MRKGAQRAPRGVGVAGEASSCANEPVATLPSSERRSTRASLLLAVAFAAALAACAKKEAPECVAPAPSCYPPAAAGACIDKPIAAECGPREARVGTHRHWMCDGDNVLASACTQITAATSPPPVAPSAVAVVVAGDDAGPARLAACAGAAPRCLNGDSTGFCGDISFGTARCVAGHWTCRAGRLASECKYVGREGMSRYLKEHPTK